MKLPEELNLKLEELSNKYKEKELREAYAGISDRYMTGKRTGSTLLEKEIDVIAYANARMPATYSAVHKAFENAFKYIKECNLKSLLDVGAGTGAATWAVSDFIEFSNINCLEKEKNMMAFGKKLMTENKLERNN